MLTTLSNLPVVSGIFGFFKTNLRLGLEYALIAAVIALGGFTVTMWIQKSQLQTSIAEMSNKVGILEIANEGHKATIESLKKERDNDARALSGLIEDVKTLAERDSTWRRGLTQLESKNETVRRYLDSPIPAELQCLLNEARQDGAGGKTGGPCPSN